MIPDFKPLKLLAKDEEDINIFSAHLQDALLPLTAMVYEAKSATFSLLANRFCWEHKPVSHEGAPLYHRVHSGLCFRNVEKVYRRGFQLKGKERVFNLLTVQTHLKEGVRMIFSGDREIGIRTKNLHCHLGDLHEPWATRKKPKHIFEYEF